MPPSTTAVAANAAASTVSRARRTAANARRAETRRARWWRDGPGAPPGSGLRRAATASPRPTSPTAPQQPRQDNPPASRAPVTPAPANAPALNRAWNLIMRTASPPTPAVAAAFMAMSTRPAPTMAAPNATASPTLLGTVAATRQAPPQTPSAPARVRAVPARSASPPVAAAASPPRPTAVDSNRPSSLCDTRSPRSTPAAATAQAPQKAPKAPNVAATGRRVDADAGVPDRSMEVSLAPRRRQAQGKPPAP